MSNIEKKNIVSYDCKHRLSSCLKEASDIPG